LHYRTICDRLHGKTVDAIADILKVYLDDSSYHEVIKATSTEKVITLLKIIYRSVDDVLFKKFCDALLKMKHESLVKDLMFFYEETAV